MNDQNFDSINTNDASRNDELWNESVFCA